MMATNYKESLLKHYADKVTFSEEKAEEFWVEKENFLEIMSYLKRMGMDLLSDITSVDAKEYFEVVYQLFDHASGEHFTIKVKLDHEKPEIESLANLWCSANWLEREVYDLMGITFLNHPNLERILLWEGFDGYPLRKDFVNDHHNRMGAKPQ